MLILLVLLIIVGAILAIKRPTMFIIYFIFSASKFGGLINTSAILVNGNSIYLFALNFIAMSSSAVNIGAWLRLNRKSKYFIGLIITYLSYGILMPYFSGYSSFAVSLAGSKHFWFYSLLIYILVYKESIDFKIVFNFVEYLGLYLSIVLIVFSLINAVPPAYLEFKPGIGFYSRIYYPTYISLALFWSYSKWHQRILKNVGFGIRFIILFIGIILSGYLSLTITSILFFGVLILFKSRSHVRAYFWGVYFLISLSLLFIMIVPEHLKDKVYKNTSEIAKLESAALVSRAIYNAQRWELIKEKPLIGYGFIHKNSSITKNINYSDSLYTESLSVIDSGYVDILGKFGFIGSLIFLVSISVIVIRKGVYIKHATFTQVCLAYFVMQYFLINLTWSVFTYEHGIIPLSLCLPVIIMEITENTLLRSEPGYVYAKK